jgi:hypothetical protein
VRVVQYLEDGEWEGDDPEPIILLVCPRTTDLIYAKRRTRGLLADVYDDDERRAMHIRFATVEKLKEHGVTEGIWEEA